MTTVMQLFTAPARYSIGVGPSSRPPIATGSSDTNVKSRTRSSVCCAPVPTPAARSVFACAGAGASRKRGLTERLADEAAETLADEAAEELAGVAPDEVTEGVGVDMGSRLGGDVTVFVNSCHIRSRTDKDHTCKVVPAGWRVGRLSQNPTATAPEVPCGSQPAV